MAKSNPKLEVSAGTPARGRVPLRLLDQLVKTGRRAREATVARDAAIRAARDAGLDYRRIGELVGLSHTRVREIARKAAEQ
jgi:hypothetical protein